MENNAWDQKIPHDNYRKDRGISQSKQERSESENGLPGERRYVRGIDLREYIGKEIPEWVVNEVLSDLAGE